VVFPAVSELLTDGFDLVSLRVVELLMLHGIDEFMLLWTLGDLVYKLLLSLCKACDLRVMLIKVPHIV